MIKKTLVIILIILSTNLIVANTGKELLENLSKEDKVKFAMLMIPNSFKLSKEYKEYKWTLNRFFTKKIYDELLGTPFTGYEYDENFKYKGNEIEIEALKILSEFKNTKYKNMFS